MLSPAKARSRPNTTGSCWELPAIVLLPLSFGVLESCSAFPHLWPLRPVSSSFQSCTGWVSAGDGDKCQLLSRSTHSCLSYVSDVQVPLCHFLLIQQRKSFSGWPGCLVAPPHLTSPSRLVCCKKGCGEPCSRTGWDGGDLQRLPSSVSHISTSCNNSSERHHHHLLDLCHRIMKWVRWDLKAHPLQPPAMSRDTSHQTRFSQAPPSPALDTARV